MFKVEPLQDILLEMAPLLVEHWLEIGVNREQIPLSPDFSKYIALQDAGVLHCVSVRVEGKLVGYSLTFLQPHLHYSKNLFALNDIIFISKDYRKGTLGFKLIKFVEDEMKRKDVSKIVYHIKTAHNFGKILERLGYTAEEINYCKYIGD